MVFYLCRFILLRCAYLENKCQTVLLNNAMETFIRVNMKYNLFQTC